MQWRFLMLFLLFPGVVTSQSSSFGNWFIYFGNQAMAKKWNWWNEVQYRNYNFAGDLQQLLLRTGVGYNLSEQNNNLLFGYGYIDTRNYLPGSNEKTPTAEHRLYQQFLTRQNFGRFYLQHRYRLEERFLPDNFSLRFRYFLALNVPLNKPALTQGAWYLSAYNEIFLQRKTPVYDRDRLYAGMGYVINKNFRTELAIMNQMLARDQRFQLQLVLFNTVPFHQPK